MRNNKQKILSIFGVVLLLAGVLSINAITASASTINVVSACSLSDAINSVNAATDQGSCTSSGTYGTNDTITLPAGTITLTANLPVITVPVEIDGAGIDQTIIDGNSGQYRVFFSTGNFSITIKDLKITAFDYYAIETRGSDLTVDNIEVDGNGVNTNSGHDLGGIAANNYGGYSNSINIDHVFVHDISGTGIILQGISVGNSGHDAITTVNIKNSTVANLSNSAGSVNCVLVSIGTSGPLDGNGTINADISNVTVSNNVSVQGVSGFGGFALAQNGTSTINITAKNITSVGIHGSVSIYATSSAAFFAGGAGIGNGDLGVTNIDVQNSLIADSLADGVSNNCAVLNLTSLFSGAGAGVGTISSLGHNISDDASCTDFNQSGDQQNVSNIISTLGPLQNNGGVVPTRALLAGSPAIASGVQVLGITLDARGVARPASNPSVGAYQYEGVIPTGPTVVPAPTSNVASSSGSLPATGQGSIPLAIFAIMLIIAGIVFARAKRKSLFKY